MSSLYSWRVPAGDPDRVETVVTTAGTPSACALMPSCILGLERGWRGSLPTGDVGLETPLRGQATGPAVRAVLSVRAALLAGRLPFTRRLGPCEFGSSLGPARLYLQINQQVLRKGFLCGGLENWEGLGELPQLEGGGAWWRLGNSAQALGAECWRVARHPDSRTAGGRRPGPMEELGALQRPSCFHPNTGLPGSKDY